METVKKGAVGLKEVVILLLLLAFFAVIFLIVRGILNAAK